MQTCLAIARKAENKMVMFKGHDPLRMIDGGRTRVWCRRFAGYAEPKLEKLLINTCTAPLEGGRDSKQFST